MDQIDASDADTNYFTVVEITTGDYQFPCYKVTVGSVETFVENNGISQKIEKLDETDSYCCKQCYLRVGNGITGSVTTHTNGTTLAWTGDMNERNRLPKVNGMHAWHSTLEYNDTPGVADPYNDISGQDYNPYR